MTTRMQAAPARSPADAANQWLVARRVLRMFVLYAGLLLMCLFVLMPIGWMLTAALKPRTAPVFTFPPEWYPTTHWRWQTFVDALTNPAQPFYRYTLNSLFICGMNIIGAVTSCSMIAYPFARLRFRGKNRPVQRRDRHDAAARSGAADPAVPAVLSHRLVRHVSAADRACVHRHPVLHLPVAPVHANDPDSTWTKPRASTAQATG